MVLQRWRLHHRRPPSRTANASGHRVIVVPLGDDSPPCRCRFGRAAERFLSACCPSRRW
jgi:hypothetical protein